MHHAGAVLPHAHVPALALVTHLSLLPQSHQVWPICGDGMDFTVRLKPNGPRRAQTLLKRAYDADPNAQPNRQKIEWKMHIRTGDVLDVTVPVPFVTHE